MNTMIEKLAEMLVVPVVVLEDAADAEKLADALVKGGLPCAGQGIERESSRGRGAASSSRMRRSGKP